MSTRVYRQGRDLLRKMRRSEDVAKECYYGKSALLQTYEQLGIYDDYVRELAVRVRLRKQMLDNRGAEV